MEGMLNGFEQIVGPVPHTMRETYVNPGETYQTGFDLTELLMNRIGPVVTSQISGLLRKSYVSPYTSFLLPMRQLGPYESTAVRWMEIHFDSGLANQVETEGVARLYQHKKNKRGARAVRRGVACKVDSMFYATPEGRELWRKQILQLATIVQRTNEYDVLSTLLNCVKRDPQFSRQGEIGNGNNVYGISDSTTYMDMLKQRVDWFGIVNKSPDSRGFSNMCTTLRTIMRRRGVDVDALIVPPHLLGYYFYTKPDLWEGQMAGPSVDKNREIATELANEDTGLRQEKWQGLTLVDSYVQRMTDGHGDGEDVSDLLTVQRQIGEFYPMCTKDWFNDFSDFKNFGARSRNIRIFNEDHSRMVNVKYSDAIRHCNAFTTGDNTSNTVEMLDPKVFRGSGFTIEKTFGSIKFDGDEQKTNMIFQMIGKSFEAQYSETQISEYTTLSTELVDESPADESTNSKDVKDAIKIAIQQIDPTVKLNGFLFKTESTKGELGLRTYTNLFINALKTVRLTKNNLIRMSDAGLYVPFDFILCRPFMQYATSSVVMMKSGVETGETLIGQQKFEMTSNVADRTLYANYFYYGKAVVRDEKNVVVAPDVFIQSYIKGNNTTFIEDFSDCGENKMANENETKSILAFIVPPGACVHNSRSIIDIRGKFDGLAEDKTHFPTSSYYFDKLSIDDTTVADPVSNWLDYEDYNVLTNTICCLGHTEDYQGNVLHTNTGHLGCETYNNCNAMRKPGVYAEIKPQQYKVKF